MEYNYYNILGISPTATAQQIKAAYKQLALKYHPDRNPGDTHAEEMFKLVNAANQTLSNPGKRALYDMRLQYQREQQRRVVYYQAQHQGQQQYTTRPPAGVSERYYKTRHSTNHRFSRKDWYITLAFVGGIVIFSLLLKFVMDHVAGEDNYKTAMAYIADGKYDSAHTLLNDAIDFIPDHAGAYEARAGIELDVYENYNYALRDLNRSIALQEHPPAHLYYMRGRSYQQLSQHQKAEQDLTQALSLNKQLWLAYLRRGEVRLFYLKRYDAAITDLTEFLKHTTTNEQAVEALTYRGFAYYKKGEGEAERDYRAALAKDKENGRLYYLLGRTEFELQQSDSACAHFYKSYQLGYSAALAELRGRCQE
ncbi:hypothetical protein GCM10028895_35400 [Pontibacter rugosus]